MVNIIKISCINLILLFNFLAFQTSTCFQYAVNSESEDSEQEIENEKLTCPNVIIFYFYKYCYILDIM